MVNNATSLEATPHTYAPFYGNKIDHCIFMNDAKIDEL
jgi:hypothetical protein